METCWKDKRNVQTQGYLVKIQAEVLGSKTLAELSHLKLKVPHGGGESYLGKTHK